MSRIRLSLALALLALAGCRSAPTRFYTLMPQSPPTAAAQAAPFRIEVMPVGVPAQVDQPQLVVRQGDGRVDLLETEQWIAPLGDEIRGAFAGALAADLGTRDVYGVPHGDAPVYRVKLDVRRFDSAPGRYALIDADWSVRKTGAGDAQPLLECSTRVREDVGAGYADLVRGHQRALAELARRIAGALRAAADGATAACPTGA